MECSVENYICQGCCGCVRHHKSGSAIWREKGHLKGQLIKNDNGVPEYRIYPNKEIIEGLKRIGSPLIASEAIQEADIVEAEAQTVFTPGEDTQDMSVDPEGIDDIKGKPGDWTDPARATAGGVAEELWSNLINRFLEKLEEKDQLIGVMRTELADKDRQLKLLPDLEKKAEEERKAAELRALEAAALQKQIEAMQAEKEEALNAQQKVEELERQMELLRAEEAEKLERLKAEKEAHESAIEKQLAAVTEELQQMRKPWWKKIFTAE
jgi:flagellar biosynthesis GTPase FlhF